MDLPVATAPGVDELLEVMARRVAEALDVCECNIYEYRRGSDELVATAIWTPDLTDEERGWPGRRFKLDERPSYRRLLEQGAVRECYVDDPRLDADDAEAMRTWGELSLLSVPLVFRDDTVGALTVVEKRAPRRFSPEDVRLLEVLAVPAAVAVHSAAVLRRETLQNRRLRALLDAGRAMSVTVEVGELLATVARSARQALDCAEVAISTFDAASRTLTVTAYDPRDRQPGWEDELGVTYRLDDYPADADILFGGAIVEEQVSDPALDEANRRWMHDNGEKTYLTVPLLHGGAPIGLLVFVELEHERHFSAAERELAAALGEQAAAAIHRAELLQRTKLQNRQLGLLLDAARTLSSSVELDDVLAEVARTTAEALQAEQCQIQEYDSAANTSTPVAFWQRDASRPEPDTLGKTFSLDEEPEERRLFDSTEVTQQRFSDPSSSDRTRAIMDKYGDRAYLNVPLRVGGQSFGLMVVVETEVERLWTDDEVALAQALAEHAAVAIERARLYARLQEQAITDGLTGLFNHRHFYQRLDHEVARARRYGTPVSLLMADMDDFKQLNDRYGHLAGDAVLRQVAAVLRSEVREGLDVIARYGGEEFAVILPNTPLEMLGDSQIQLDLSGGPSASVADDGPPAPGHRGGAELVAERIRRRIAHHEFVAADGTPLMRVTVSVGVAVFPHKTSTSEELVANADAALYKAKRAGRDRVASYG